MYKYIIKEKTILTTINFMYYLEMYSLCSKIQNYYWIFENFSNLKLSLIFLILVNTITNIINYL